MLKRNQVQEEYSSIPEQARLTDDNRSFDISVKEEHDIVRTCSVNAKWQEQIIRKLSTQIKQRIEPIVSGKKKHDEKEEAEFDYEALFSFTSQSFGVFIETQDGPQAECLNLIKNSYELLLKLSIDQMLKQNESLRFQVKQLLSQAKKKQPQTATNMQGKKVKQERYSHDQAQLLEKLKEKETKTPAHNPKQAAEALQQQHLQN